MEEMPCGYAENANSKPMVSAGFVGPVAAFLRKYRIFNR
jgi:hypothetical protein